MSDDPRCCGSGMCIIDPGGRCWCGQQWDGQKMVAPSLISPAAACGTSESTLQTPAGLGPVPVRPEPR